MQIEMKEDNILPKNILKKILKKNKDMVSYQSSHLIDINKSTF